MPDDIFPFPIDFKKMGFALERASKMQLASKIQGAHSNVLVDHNTANIRSKLCASCHNNLPKKEARCGCVISEESELNQFSRDIIENQKTPYDKQLQFCNIDGADNRLAVWLFPYWLINSTDINHFPTFCWKKEAP